MTPLTGKIIVVTGGAGGQGAAHTTLLAGSGATVVTTDVRDDEGIALARRLSEDSTDVQYRRLDVTNADDWTRLADWLSTTYHEIHGLVNNAGSLSVGRVGEATTIAEWDRVMAVNVTGPLLGMTMLGQLLAPGASVVNIGSSAGVTAHYRVAYTASKWALRGLSRCAALEYGARGIRVNTVLPGMIDTPMTAGLASLAKQAQIAETPMGRAGTVADVASVVRFLLSDESAYLSGTEIMVDGGFTAHGGVKSISDAARAAVVG